MMTDIEQTKDLIPMAQAEKLAGYSRVWIKNRVQIYVVKGRDKVSRSAVLRAKAEYETPHPKDSDEK